MRVCMVVYSFYESDTRVMQYATALSRRGDTVDVVALRREGANSPQFEILNGVNVHRIQARTVNEKGLFTYASRVLRFLLNSMLFLRKQHRERRYDLIHVHNVPDFLVLSALFPKLNGVPIVLDIHDLLPEFYASKFKVRPNSLIFKLLIVVEKCSAAFATHVIVANHVWRDRLAARSSTLQKCSVVRNHPDMSIFLEQSDQNRQDSGKFLLTYPGSLNHHQGLDVAIRAFARVANQMPNAEFNIYGEGPAKDSLISLARDLGMQDRIVFHRFLPTREVAVVMAATDLAIEPKRSTSAFGNEALSTKILEFMALGVPVIASKTSIHAYYYDESIIQYYENDDEVQLSEQILRLANNPELRAQIAARAKEYAKTNHWDARKHEYLYLLDGLTQRGHEGRLRKVIEAH